MSIIPDDGPRSPEALAEAAAKQKGRRARKGEVIGGGWFVFRRGKRSGRIGTPAQWPFEHPSEESALAEAGRLAMKHPGETFQILRAGTTVLVEVGTEPAS